MAENNKTAQSGDSNLESFENDIKRIDEIVKLLENGKAGLGDSLRLYEEGIGLIAKCSGAIDAAERRIQILQKKNGVLTTEEFTVGDN